MQSESPPVDFLHKNFLAMLQSEIILRGNPLHSFKGVYLSTASVSQSIGLLVHTTCTSIVVVSDDKRMPTQTVISVTRMCRLSGWSAWSLACHDCQAQDPESQRTVCSNYDKPH